MNRLDELSNQIEEIFISYGIPAAVVLYAKQGKPQFLKAFGSVLGRNTTIDCVFDCASLTKPLLTTLLTLMAVDEGKLDINEPLGTFFVDANPDLAMQPLHSLLTHSSGIRAWHPLYCHGQRLDQYVNTVLHLPIKGEGEKCVIYSCLNYVLLSSILQAVFGYPLTTLINKNIFTPLNLVSTSMHSSSCSMKLTAPTEHGDQFEQAQVEKLGLNGPKRTDLIHGVVHDGNAYYCQSQSGNSGLFSTASDLLILSEQWSPKGRLLTKLSLELLARFDTPWGPESRTLGWQWAKSKDSSAGPDLSDNAIGHSGFTGTSLWYDWNSEETFIILTNRIHPKVTETPMNAVRRQIHSSIKRSFN
jgi:CubicO group peptidase (beta-lactamase class C family)